MPSLVQRYRALRFGVPIVVVSGLPRSGTSLVMGMFAAGGLEIVTDGARAADEHNPRGYFEYERVKTLDGDHQTTWLASARGKAIKVVSFLLPRLPETNNYRVVFMQRDLGEVLASQRKMLGPTEPEDPAADTRLATAYELHLGAVRDLLRRRSSFTVFDLRYDDVLRDPLEHAARLSEFVGRRLDVAGMATVVETALYRNRR